MTVSPARRARGAGWSSRAAGSLRLLFAEPVLRPVLLALIPLGVTLEAVNVVEIFLLRDALGVPPEQVGILTVALGGGAVAGSAAAGRIDRAATRVRVIFAAFGAMGLLTAASGVAPSYGVLLALQASCGAANALSNGLLMALVVDRIPDERSGDANAALNGMARELGTVALLLGGWLGGLIGPRPTFLLCGAVSSVIVVAVVVRRARSVTEGSSAAELTSSDAAR